jgi:hypothetical protein
MYHLFHFLIWLINFEIHELKMIILITSIICMHGSLNLLHAVIFVVVFELKLK